MVKCCDKRKRVYQTLSIESVEILSESKFLAASVVPMEGSKIQSVSQELGKTYLFSTDNGIDGNTGKTFSHEWEAGSGE